MVNLIIKDMRIQKKQLLIGFAYILVFVVAFQSMDVVMYTTAVVAFAYMMLLTSCAYEDKNKSDILLNCLPLNRNTIVAAKYFSAFVFMIIGTIAYFLLAAAVALLHLPLTISPVTLEGFIGGLVAIALTTGVYLPIFFKIGYMKSRFMQFIIFFGFFFGISFAVNFIVRHVDRQWLEVLTDLYNAQANAVVLLITGAALVFLAISYVLSVWLYRGREF